MAELAGTYELGPANGRVLVRTGREGLAARVGHDLTLEVTSWSASVVVPPSGNLGEATVTASLDLASLVVREGSGGAKPLTDRDRREIEKQARKSLGSSATASFTSSRVDPLNAEVEGTLTLRGTARPFRFPVTEAEPGRYRGSAALKQTDFGITPYSGFFGALKLRDEVTIDFELTVGQQQALVGSLNYMMLDKPAWVFDREREQRGLTAAFLADPSPRATLGVVRCRRRQRKSYLLQALAQQTGGLYFAATEATEAESLRLFAQPVRGRSHPPARARPRRRGLTQLRLASALRLHDERDGRIAV